MFFCQKDNNSELSGVWGKELFESDEKKKKDERSERTPRVFPMQQSCKEAVFLTSIVLVLFLQKVHELDSGNLDPRIREDDRNSEHRIALRRASNDNQKSPLKSEGIFS